MEIPEISMLSEFEAGVTCLQNPSLFSRFFTISGIFWKWGALLIALVATFSSIIRRIKLFFVYVRTIRPSNSSAEPLLHYFTDSDLDFSSSEEEEDECSSVSSIDDEPRLRTTSFHDLQDDFSVAGSSRDFTEKWQNGNFGLRRRRGSSGAGGERLLWSEFSAGKSVVKLWDSLALGLDFDNSSENVISLFDLDKDQKIDHVFASGSYQRLPAVAVTSPAVVLSAEVNDKRRGVVLGAYDTRMGRRIPAICAEWGTPAAPAKSLGINSRGVKKVYVRDDVTGIVTVGDMRNAKTPLESLSEPNGGDTWWDADAVIVDGEFVKG